MVILGIQLNFGKDRVIFINKMNSTVGQRQNMNPHNTDCCCGNECWLHQANCPRKWDQIPSTVRSAPQSGFLHEAYKEDGLLGTVT